MRFAGLFAGIGGFELGLSRAGHHTELLCEIDDAAQAVLAARFPGIRIASDVRELRRLPRDVDAICAGFPCQDLSQAGKTAGIDGARSGLVSEVFRLLETHDVPTVVLENVPFMLQLARGDAMRRIASRFEELGYLWAWRVVDAYGFGLPQRRERVLMVASRGLDPADVLLAEDKPLKRRETALGKYAHGFYWTEGVRGLGWAVDSIPTLKVGSSVGIPAPPAMLMRDGVVIKPEIRDAERLQGFDGDWTKPAEEHHRASRRWTLVGNAVSVRVAEWIGTRLGQPLKYDPARDGRFPSAGILPKAARFDGGRRYSVEISTDPLGLAPPHLHRFLQHPGTPLSARATGGFLSRTMRSQLRFPGGFLDALRAHHDRMLRLEQQFFGERRFA
jgi:DNA (cytosine-5)-methyltransferase 1